jgi:AcrR family transcriptional regulator
MQHTQHKSAGVSEPLDPRVEKTRESIAGAFAQLLQRRTYARIRVSDITRRAGVGRATFYAHYATKDALLNAQLEHFLCALLRSDAGASCPIDATALFSHILQVRPVFRSLCLGPARAASIRIVQDALETKIGAMLSPRGELRLDAAPAFEPRFVAATMLTLIEWALEQQPAPAAAQLQATFGSLVGGALAAHRSA